MANNYNAAGMAPDSDITITWLSELESYVDSILDQNPRPQETKSKLRCWLTDGEPTLQELQQLDSLLATACIMLEMLRYDGRIIDISSPDTLSKISEDMVSLIVEAEKDLQENSIYLEVRQWEARGAKYRYKLPRMITLTSLPAWLGPSPYGSDFATLHLNLVTASSLDFQRFALYF